MKQIIIDIIGLIGLAMLGYALHGVDPRLAYGIIGIILMGFAYLAAKESANKPPST